MPYPNNNLNDELSFRKFFGLTTRKVINLLKGTLKSDADPWVIVSIVLQEEAV